MSTDLTASAGVVDIPEMPDETLLLVAARAATGPDGTQGWAYETRYVEGDLLVALAWTTVEQLVAGAGEDQPWLGVPAGVLRRDLDRRGIARLLIDVDLVPAARWVGSTPPPGLGA